MYSKRIKGRDMRSKETSAGQGQEESPGCLPGGGGVQTARAQSREAKGLHIGMDPRRPGQERGSISHLP